MAFDSLKRDVTTYGNKKDQLREDNLQYTAERDKAAALSLETAHLDTEIAQATAAVEESFDLEKYDLEKKAEVLEQERDSLAKTIEQERAKLETVQKKLDGVSGKKGAGSLQDVTHRCSELLRELENMSGSLDAEGTAGAGAGAGRPADSRAQLDKSGAAAPQGRQSIWSRLFSRQNSSPGGLQFGSCTLEPIRNRSDFFVRGSAYEQFISDYYHAEQSTYQSLENGGIVTTISPAQIEGIHLGQTEAADSSIFWSQHKSDGTRESFVEIASHIPQVRALQEAGVPLDEIRQNPELAECVRIYFDPSSIPCVVQSNGYYEFDSNGRHRILAAREAGYDIPVRVIGIRKWRNQE